MLPVIRREDVEQPCGLPVPEAELLDFAGVPVLAV
jgi:hypothetical protein